MNARRSGYARTMIARRLSVALVVSALLALSCASKTGPTKGTGTKVLEGVVVERDHDAPGAGGAGFQGTGNYYLVIEAKDGDATAHYRYQVSYRQWFRFPEGSHVRITLRNNFLQDIQPNE
jgi:hypothetical protein